MNCESEILRKKYICKSNTENNMKLMILEKIRVICTCSSSPRAASVLGACRNSIVGQISASSISWYEKILMLVPLLLSEKVRQFTLLAYYLRDFSMC